MLQTWNNLLFLHWPLPPKTLKGLLPPSLPLDTYQGQAWVGIVPFTMDGIRFRGLPPLPGFSAFPETNLRTYVKRNGKAGVYFFSLDAQNPAAVLFARLRFHLPYYYSRFTILEKGPWIDYTMRRRAPGAPAVLRVSYRPVEEGSFPSNRSLADWLTARYCLYTADKAGNIYRGEIHHAPWTLRPAKAVLRENSLTKPLGIKLPASKPLAYFSKTLSVKIWELEKIGP